MRYPIDAEAYISALDEELDANENDAEIFRAYIPFVNGAYHAGLNGQRTKDLLVYVTEYEKQFGAMDNQCRNIIAGFARWAREAYMHGQQDARKRAIEPENTGNKPIPRV